MSVTAPAWMANTALNGGAESVFVGYTIVDPNGNLQIDLSCAAPGNTSSRCGHTTGATQATWNTTVGQTTSDGTAVWTNEGPVARVNEPQWPDVAGNTGGLVRV